MLCFFVLSGCQSGEYYIEYDHTEPVNPSAQNTVDSFDDLRRSIIDIVDSFRDGGSISVSNYPGDLDADVNLIIDSILTSYPLGAYAVSSINYSASPLLSYVDLSVSVKYRYSAEQLSDIHMVYNLSALGEYLTEMFAKYQAGTVLSLYGFFLSDEQLTDHINKAWFNSPQTALELKGASWASYPVGNTNRIIAFGAEYFEQETELREATTLITATAAQVARGFKGETDLEKLAYVFDWLNQNVAYDEDAMVMVARTEGSQPKTSTYTALGALVEHKAAQSGVALGAKLLCDALGFDSVVICGERNGEPYVWLFLQVDGGWIHFDPTVLMTDPEAWTPPETPPETVPETPPEKGEGGEKAEGAEPSEEEPAVPVPAEIYLFSAAEAQQRFSWNSTVYGF